MLKEILTAVVDALAAIGIVIPGLPLSKWQALIDKIRGICNMIDGWLETAKSFLLGIGS